MEPCGICHEPILENVPKADIIICHSHAFHRGCIVNWRLVSDFKKLEDVDGVLKIQCPYCQQNINAELPIRLLHACSYNPSLFKSEKFVEEMHQFPDIYRHFFFLVAIVSISARNKAALSSIVRLKYPEYAERLTLPKRTRPPSRELLKSLYSFLLDLKDYEQIQNVTLCFHAANQEGWCWTNTRGVLLFVLRDGRDDPFFVWFLRAYGSSVNSNALAKSAAYYYLRLPAHDLTNVEEVQDGKVCDKVKYLLEERGSFYYGLGWRRYLLPAIVFKGDLTTLYYFLKKKNSDYIITVIRIAIKFRKIECMEAALKLAEPNLLNKFWITSFVHLAAKNNFPEAIDLLKQYGVVKHKMSFQVGYYIVRALKLFPNPDVSRLEFWNR